MTEAKMGRAASFGEPWRIDERDFGLVDARDFEVEVGLPEYDGRIVACVNALAGIPDPAEYRAAVDALREAAEKARGTLAESMYDTGAIARGACQLAHRQLAEALDALARLESGEGEG